MNKNNENAKIAENLFNVLSSLNMKETAESFRREYSSKNHNFKNNYLIIFSTFPRNKHTE
jgi:hypothetical protein